MKYKPQYYAQAFSEVTSGKLTPAEEKKIIGNFLATVEKNGDINQLGKIVAETERLLRLKSGKRKVLLETAREIHPSPKAKLKELIKTSDIVEEKINPELVAGIRITVNDELEYDGSLASKLKNLF